MCIFKTKHLYILILISLFSFGCSEDTFLLLPPAELTPGQEDSASSSEFSILISSGDANHRGITSYNLEGESPTSVLDLRAFGGTPNGLAQGETSSFLISVDIADSVLQSPFSSETSFFYGTNLLSGNIFDIEYGPVMDYYYVVESNNIEVFDSLGLRQDSALIPTNLGSCVLNIPRNMHATEDGFLYVANLNGDRINKYDINDHVATCADSYSLPGLEPTAVIRHSNSLLYFSSRSDDAIYTLDESDLTLVNIFAPGLTILRDPTALTELPNGDVIVSSSFLDSIERIDASGVRIGTSPFIRDVFSLNVRDIEIVENP